MTWAASQEGSKSKNPTDKELPISDRQEALRGYSTTIVIKYERQTKTNKNISLQG